MGVNIYESIGSFFENDNFVETQINPKLFTTNRIIIKVVPTIVLDESINIGKDPYLITGISIDENFQDGDLSKIISNLNEKIKKGNNFDRHTWKLFYLFKELITSLQQLGYNYFRGQQQNWVTKPAIFRNFVKKKTANENKKHYYKEFEKLYQEISHEFPNELKYVEYPITNKTNIDIQNRSNSLSILQHYGIPTSLLDITENPFVALLFMFGTEEEIKNPQLEAYLINSDKHEKNGIVTFVDKTAINKRIKAQHGAFLNYDKLVNFSKITKDNFQLEDTYCPINRIIITVEIDKNDSIDYFNRSLNKDSNSLDNIEIKFKLGKFLKEINLDKYSPETFEELTKKLYPDSKNPNEEFLKDYITILKETKKDKLEEFSAFRRDMEKNSDEIIKNSFAYIKDEMIKKLGEFNYFEKGLYPDFVDYLKFKKNEYKLEGKRPEPHYKFNTETINQIEINQKLSH